MYFKISAICFLAFASAKAGFLNHGQNIGNLGNNGHPVVDPSNRGFGFQQQVPLTLNPGPIPQNNASPNPHSGSISSFGGQSSSQQQPSYNYQLIVPSTAVNSVPAAITSHDFAAAFVPVPSHGFYGINNAGGNPNSNANNNNNNNNNNNAPNNGLGSNGGAGQGSFGYGGYGYSFSSAGGNSAANSGNNQGNNAGSYFYGYSGNGAPGNNNGFSG
ncbi:hypothetical protein FQR65_LT14404 [Abscondita terminalis]|nr:hypothetical protein FQR65_LT14404 [Abscondita terminalis]